MVRYISIFIIIVFVACKSNESRQDEIIRGGTMGTYYSITCPSDKGAVKTEIDSLLMAFNDQVSTYIPTSTISRFNQSDSIFAYERNRDNYFHHTLLTSLEIYNSTSGFFDPSVMPLVNYWGFGYKKPSPDFVPDSSEVLQMMSYIGLNKLVVEGSGDSVFLHKPTSDFQLDFSAIAKGYGVDVVAQYLQEKGIQNYLVDIGGEGICKGINRSGKEWTFGINTPDEEAPLNDLTAILSFTDRAIATSGNYRNFYEKEGRKFVHTVNPKTGFSEPSDVLSVTVLADSCIYADAYATAMMAMGKKDALTLAKALNLDILLITGNGKGGYDKSMSPNMSLYLKE